MLRIEIIWKFFKNISNPFWGKYFYKTKFHFVSMMQISDSLAMFIKKHTKAGTGGKIETHFNKHLKSF